MKIKKGHDSSVLLFTCCCFFEFSYPYYVGTKERLFIDIFKIFNTLFFENIFDLTEL
jgi:hypothetical protein